MRKIRAQMLMKSIIVLKLPLEISKSEVNFGEFILLFQICIFQRDDGEWALEGDVADEQERGHVLLAADGQRAAKRNRLAQSSGLALQL